MNAFVVVVNRTFAANWKLVAQACVSCAILFLASCSTHRPIRESDYSKPIRVACVGDSITFGIGIKDRARDSYPVQLQTLLGDRWSVMNFGFSGATLLKQGTKPYTQLPAYREALSSKPDVVIIELGTNDTNPKSWPPHKGEFVGDYLDLIRSFRELETKPRIFLCLPVPLFRDRGKEYDTDKILTNEVIPKIREVARKARVPVIDLNDIFADKGDLLPDGVHPDAHGAHVMAVAIRDALIGEQSRTAQGAK